MKKIGGQKLKELGSSRYTDDVDYLVYLPGKELFITSPIEDQINAAAGNKFFEAIWNKEIDNNEVSLNSLFELKCYSYVQHCQNMNFTKADNDEFDLKFLARKMNFEIDCKIVSKHITSGQVNEIAGFINSMKK